MNKSKEIPSYFGKRRKVRMTVNPKDRDVKEELQRRLDLPCDAISKEFSSGHRVPSLGHLLARVSLE